MPKQSGPSFLPELGPKIKSAHAEARGTEVKVDSGGRLPAGIEAGVAQLVDCRIAKVKEGGANAGKWQFIGRGMVKEPAKYAGLNTQVIIPLYETPNRSEGNRTVEDHYKAMESRVAALLGRRDIGDETAPENVEATLAALAKVKPHFRFRTWAGAKQVIDQRKDGKWIVWEEQDGKRKPSTRVTGAWATREAAEKANPYAGREPMVNENWGALVDWSANGQPAIPMSDQTGGQATQEDDFPTAEAGEAAAGEEVVEESGEGGPDLAELAAAAAGGDAEAEKAMVQLAVEAGIEDAESKIESAASWEDVVKMIEEAQGESDESPEDEEEEEEEEEPEKAAAPEKGDPVKHTIQVTVKNKKTGKRSKKDKQIEAEVVTVNTKAQTVTLKNLEDGKTIYKDVPWDQLG